MSAADTRSFRHILADMLSLLWIWMFVLGGARLSRRMWTRKFLYRTKLASCSDILTSNELKMKTLTECPTPERDCVCTGIGILVEVQ